MCTAAKAYLNQLQTDREEVTAAEYDTDDSGTRADICYHAKYFSTREGMSCDQLFAAEEARGVTRNLTHEELAERLQKQAMEVSASFKQVSG